MILQLQKKQFKLDLRIKLSPPYDCAGVNKKGGIALNVKEIYENALALSISRADEEDSLEFYAVKLFNILLDEVNIYNNQLRVKKGKEPLEKSLYVESLDQQIDCEQELYAALSYGFAAKLLAAQEDFNLATLYNNQYITLLAVTSPAVEMEVE